MVLVALVRHQQRMRKRQAFVCLGVHFNRATTVLEAPLLLLHHLPRLLPALSALLNVARLFSHRTSELLLHIGYVLTLVHACVFRKQF